MKFYLTDFSKDGIIDGHIYHCFNQISKYSNHEIVADSNQADIILFAHVYKHDYNFKEEDIGNKPIVIIDYVEMGDIKDVPHFICFNMSLWFEQFEEWNSLNNWLKSKQDQIKIYFKREFYKDLYQPHIPTYSIDFIAFQDCFYTQKTSDFIEFDERIFKLAMIFGFSNISRPILYAEMVKQLYHPRMCLDERMLEYDAYNQKENSNLLLLYKPYYMRMDFSLMMDLYSKSKIAISLWGAGRKCFREPEVSFNSVPAIQETNQYYSYPWVDGENCIILPNKIHSNNMLLIDAEKSLDKMLSHIEQPEKLYEIYLNSQKNCLNYRIDNYLKNYIIPKLESVL